MGGDNEMGIDEGLQEKKKGSGMYCSNAQILFAVIISAGIIVGVGLLAFYLPDRTCVEETPGATEPIRATEPNQKTEPQPEPTDKQPEPATTEVMATEAPWNGRLSYDVWPLRYELTLTPYLYEEDVMPDGPGGRRFTFDGEVNIRVECRKATDMITMHINNITIYDLTVVRLTDSAKTNLTSTVEIDETYQFLHIKLTEMMDENEDYEVQITYLGELWTGLAGFYRSTYTNEMGVDKFLATTQMQPTDARRALPCFDEPDFRAVFDIAIRHRSDMTALSNGLEISTTEWEGVDDWSVTLFKRTPKMSTYLLAFVVSDFVKTEAVTENGVLFRVWSRPGAVAAQKYALESGVIMTTYFEEYFDIAYPLEKQDMMAIPDFAAGAMENWGLILYRETALLYDSAVNSASNKQRVSVVVSHELAHQWFGNLVTPIWWDDLWLNEGFASYVEYLGVNRTEPKWEMEAQFLVNDLHYVMTLDALGTSHPVRVPVNSPVEINEIFDTISYSKGASILRMLNWILTEEVFVKGLSDYLKLHSYDNTDSDDLWAALTYADRNYGERDVKTIMDTWTLQMGYPLVTFDRIGSQVNVSQKHFLIDPTSPVDDKYIDLGYVWEVEVSHTHKSQMEYDNPQRSNLPRVKHAMVDLAPGIQANDWYLANVGQYGYYRINYDAENWERLTDQLNTNHEVLPVENRAQLIDDAFNLARSGDLDQVTALSLTAYLDNELEYLPWEASLTVLAYIRDMFSRYPGYGPLEKYMLQKITPLYNELTWDDDPINDDHLVQYNRINAVFTACFFGLEECRMNASMLYAEYMMDPEVNPITPNLKQTTYCNGISEGGQEEWEFGLERYQATTDSAEKSKWLYGMSCSQEPWILSRYLELAFDDTVIRGQDATYVIRYTADNYVGRALAWDFTRANWDRLREQYGGGSFSFSNLINDVTQHFNTEFDLEQLKEFGEGRDFGSARRAYEQAIEKTEINIKWMEENAEEVATWLEDNITV